MNKGIYRIAAGVGAAVILVSSATAQAATVTANGTPAPVASDSIAGWPAAPAVTSETAVLIDADTGAVLYDKGMDEYRYPASTTKLMTLLVAIENSSPKDIRRQRQMCIRDRVMKCSNYKIPATNLREARVMHTHMPLMAKESNLYYAGCIGGKTGFSTDAQHTLVTAAERNGRTYIAVTMRAADLGINCTDSTSLFNYAFDNFDTIDVDGTAMTVPKGVTVNDLTTDTAERNGKTLTRYYYSGQFVGYVAEAQPTETPAVEETAETAAESSETEAAETVTDSLETTENDSQAEVQTGQKSMSEQIQEIRTEGLSGMMKALLIAMGVMAVILIALLIALYIKNG